MKRLIINADDFGLTAGVNRAIVELHRRGTLTSTTLMAHASATEAAIDLAVATPMLGIGCHVVLVDGESVLPSTKLPLLTDPAQTKGSFEPKLGRFLGLVYGNKGLFIENAQLAREMQAEATAQIALLQSCGLRLTHLDTHKHTHMFPRVLRPVLRAARTRGIRVVRNPFEPPWSRHATPGAPWLRQAQVSLLHTLESSFRRIVAEEGFITTDGAVGVLATGTLNAAALTSLLTAMPEGTWELVTHPGYNDADLANAGTRLLASREIELYALRDLAVAEGIKLIHFGQLDSSS